MKVPAATAVPMTPATFGPIACIRRKFVGSACAPTFCETRAAIGTADTPAEPISGLIFPCVTTFRSWPSQTPPAVPKMNAIRPRTTIFSVITLLWISPLLIVLLNSFKRKAFIFKNPFSVSRYSLISDGFEKWQKGIEKAFFGLQNYTNGIQRTNFWNAFGCSLFITIFSVAAILLFCSMTAWFVVR